MEPDLQALLAERAALALSLGVTVDDEVFFLEDLLLEVQLLLLLRICSCRGCTQNAGCLLLWMSTCCGG